jgi:hypothetical protein
MVNLNSTHLHYLFNIPVAQSKPKLKIYCLKNDKFRIAMTFGIHEIKILKNKGKTDMLMRQNPIMALIG